MTEVNGLRLAVRGLTGGLTAGYVWLAVTLLLAAPFGDPLAPHARLADSVLPASATREGSLLLGLSVAQLVGGAFGLLFAYFVGRFFTVRPTMLLAATCVALLAWLAAGSATDPQLTAQIPMLVAVLVYGAVLGHALPLRNDVLRPMTTANASRQGLG